MPDFKPLQGDALKTYQRWFTAWQALLSLVLWFLFALALRRRFQIH